MTYLIDISGHQATLNIEAVKPDNEAVIVKAVASYLPGLTVAEAYASNVDRVVAAGLPKGHYAIPNGANDPEATAVFMAERLHGYTGGDVLALDNEILDAYGTFWRDADCARFFRELHAQLGHPFERMWLYCPAHQTRTNGPWTETLGLGVKVWWVSYGDNDPLLEDGEEPLLGGGVTQWDVHQFTSTYRVSGYAGNLDRNYTPHEINDLFGGVDVGFLEARPAKGNMNQGFGPRPKPTPTSPAIHYGQDYGWGGGDGIYAAADGVVRAYASSGAYGNRLVIDHGAGRQTWYCHLTSAVVGVGAQVVAGQHVAWMGATGNVTAKHLHFELRINGVASDPAPHFVSGATAGSGTTPIDNSTPAKPIDLGDIMARYLWAANRGGILITETDGVFFPSMAGVNEPLAWEYRAAQKLIFNGIDVDTRVWDVCRQDALDRQSAAGKRTDDKITAAINAAIDAKLTGDINVDAGVEIDVEAIATAVREKFRADPLK